MYRAIRPFAALFALALLVSSPVYAQTTFFGPVPYLSAADTPEDFSNDATEIEDFEDGQLDPRLSASTPTIVPPGGITDSVDADDGDIDGSGNGGTTLFGGNIRIDFAPPFPTSAGMVWTDGAAGAVTFEAFGPDGSSLGTVGPETLGDGSISGTTAEDRFFGARDAAGISAIQLLSGAVMEIDHIQFSGRAVEPAIMSTVDDSNDAVLLPDPANAIAAPQALRFSLPGGSKPHGLAFLGGRDVVFADLLQPQLYRAALSDPASVEVLALGGRSSANGTLAVDPNGRYAISIGESSGGVGESVVIDFRQDPPQVSPIAGGLRVRSFVTAAVDFAPDGRAFVCHTGGVSVLHRPYVAIEYTMPFPALELSPSMCRLSPDGSRLFVTRVLSESVAMPNGVHTTAAPYSAGSVFVQMPAPADIQGLGPMVVSPDGETLLVAQQFLFPPTFTGQRARAFALRAPFDANTQYQEIALPAAVSGTNCDDGGASADCPGFEHFESSRDGTLAILSGNSAAEIAGAADNVPAVFITNPFGAGTRAAHAAIIAAPQSDPGRGAGGVRFQPDRIFADSVDY